MSKPKITGQGIATVLVWGGMALSCLGGGAYGACHSDNGTAILIGAGIAVGGSLLSLGLSSFVFYWIDRWGGPPAP